MSRHMGASSDRISLGSGAISGVPITMSVWIKFDNPQDGVSFDCLIGLFGTGGLGDQGLYIEANQDGVNGKLVFCKATDNSNWVTDSNALTDINDTKWHHVCGVFQTTSTRITYLDGVAGTNTGGTARTPTLNQTEVGDYISAANNPSNNIGFAVANAAMWNIDLTAQEVAALAAGARPRTIRPTLLQVYAPLWGLGSSEPEMAKQLSFTITGTTFQNHAPIPLWTPRRSVVPIISVPAGGGPTRMPVVFVAT